MATLLQMPPTDFPDETSFHLHALTFHMDHIQLTSAASCAQFNSLEEFVSKFESYTSSCPQSIHYHHSKLMMPDLEAFIDFFQQLEYSCFSSVDNPIEVSNLPGPNCFAKESLLGYFIRNIIVQWERLEFNQICDIFTEYQQFCRSSSSSSMIEPVLPYTPDEFEFESNLTRALSIGDIHLAMELSHAHYDLNDPSPQNLQQAILTQALIYIHGSHYASAKTALEEVIKIAHSRNDHESIAKAIELLFHVTHNSESIGNSAEELLVTCIEKNTQLKLSGPAAKSSLYLVTSRSCNRRPFNSTEGRLTIDWTALHVALLGDSKLLLSLLRRQSERESLQSAYAVSEVAVAKADRPLTAAEADDLHPDFHLARMAFWQSHGRPALALQSGRRFLHRLGMGVVSDIDGALQTILFIARLRARLSCSLFLPQHERCVCRMASAEEIVRCASELSPQASIHLLRVLRYSELYVRGIAKLRERESHSSRITAFALTDKLMHAQLASDEMFFEARTLSALLLHKGSEEEVLRELAGIAVEARAAGLSSVQEEVKRISLNLTEEKNR